MSLSPRSSLYHRGAGARRRCLRPGGAVPTAVEGGGDGGVWNVACDVTEGGQKSKTSLSTRDCEEN